MARSEIVKAAEQYIGVPFQHQGRSQYGMDCIGLVLAAYRDAGYTPPIPGAYARVPHPRTMRRELMRGARILGRDEWQPADVLWFRIRRQPQHLALWTGSDLIHAYSVAGRVVRQPLDGSWTAQLEAALRYRGFDE